MWSVASFILATLCVTW